MREVAVVASITSDTLPPSYGTCRVTQLYGVFSLRSLQGTSRPQQLGAQNTIELVTQRPLVATRGV